MHGCTDGKRKKGINREKRNMFYDTEDLKDGEIQLRLERTAEGNPEKNWVPA